MESSTAIVSGGRTASTSVVSPYGGPVITGKPGKHLAPSRFGFSRSASRPMPSGQFMCMALPPTDGTHSESHHSVVNTAYSNSKCIFN